MHGADHRSAGVAFAPRSPAGPSPPLLPAHMSCARYPFTHILINTSPHFPARQVIGFLFHARSSSNTRCARDPGSGQRVGAAAGSMFSMFTLLLWEKGDRLLTASNFSLEDVSFFLTMLRAKRLNESLNHRPIHLSAESFDKTLVVK